MTERATSLCPAEGEAQAGESLRHTRVSARHWALAHGSLLESSEARWRRLVARPLLELAFLRSGERRREGPRFLRSDVGVVGRGAS
jgi:hypothetical protein